jgi:DNA-binding response OmpR family regulator
MAKVLVVEDDRDLAKTLQDLIGADDHAVDIALTGSHALAYLQDCQYDLILLDVHLPEENGISVLKKYRHNKGTGSVIMLTSRSAIADKLDGLDSGADDYVTKPFEPRELISRVRAQLRRVPIAQYTERLVARDLSLDMRGRVCKKGELEIKLQPREFALLEFFMRRPHEIFSSTALIARVWSSSSEVTQVHLRVLITTLRGKIDGPDELSYIETVHRVGYRFRA